MGRITINQNAIGKKVLGQEKRDFEKTVECTEAETEEDHPQIIRC